MNSDIEIKLLDIILNQYHLYLLLWIVGIIYMLGKITPISNILFSEKWKWMIVPLNLALSFFGMFVMKMTDVQETKLKIVFAIIVSMMATATYEWFIKRIDQIAEKKLGGN
jgi:predicted membrane channel-forming protein YqfA (hemolysin III family)